MDTVGTGVIRNKVRRNQIVNYSGLRFGSITPTDLDGLLEFYDQAWVGIELKLEGVEIQRGQELAFERATDDWQKSGKPALFIVADHAEYDTEKEIDAANATIRKYRSRRRWITPTKTITVRELIDAFIVREKIGTSDVSTTEF